MNECVVRVHIYTYIQIAAGNILPEDIAEFKAAGADYVLLKPLKLHELEGALRKIQNQGHGDILHK